MQCSAETQTNIDKSECYQHKSSKADYCAGSMTLIVYSITTAS